VNRRTIESSRSLCPWSPNSLRCAVNLSAIVFTALITLGCSNTADQKLSKLRTQFVLAEEPASPSSIEAAIAGIAEKPEVTLLGRINAGSSEPFDPAQATVVLSEAPDPAHNHDPGDCPFCKRRLENAKSCIVRFLDDKGEVIKQDARELLGVTKDQDVIVTGKATLLTELDILQVDATGIFVRPAAVPAK
jgi:hypothetical protein